MFNKTFQEDLLRYIGAGYNGIYITSAETEAIVQDVQAVLTEKLQGMTIRWDCHKGGRLVSPKHGSSGRDLENAGIDIIAFFDKAIASHIAYCNSSVTLPPQNSQLDRLRESKDEQTYTAVILENIHLIWGNPGILQAVINAIKTAKGHNLVYIAVGSDIDVPHALQQYMHELERPIPTLNEIETIAKDYVKKVAPKNSTREQREVEYNLLFPPENRDAIFHAAHGLTETDIIDAFAMGYTLSKGVVGISPKTVAESKVHRINTSSALELCDQLSGGLDSLGGLDYLKNFVLRSTRDRANKELTAKGVLLTGVSGTGKTSFCRAIGKELNLPVLRFALGTLLDKFVGNSEKATKQALKQIDQMSPVILMIDEMEKLLAGSSRSGGESDGGSMRRILSSILSWLQDRTNDTYVIGTCNEVEGLPPELLRAGRFDAVFFMDFPSREEKQKIWEIYRTKYTIGIKDPLPDDAQWTGTEISQCCYFASMWEQSLVDAAKCIVPVALASADKIQKLKKYATDKFLDATYGGLYDPAQRGQK
jgi:hypothetical protein